MVSDPTPGRGTHDGADGRAHDGADGQPAALRRLRRGSAGVDGADLKAAGPAALAAVVSYLNQQRGVDFAGYKPTTLARRVDQAMSRLGVEDLEAYLDHLQANTDSLDALLDDLLINVTSFFRDVDMWTELREQILPPILARGDGLPLRVWSAGCASGEEAYSLAMTIADLVGPQRLREQVKIYATDVDTQALSTARAAQYSEQAVAEIPQELRSRYLEPAGEGRWAVTKELRRAVVFGRNDIMQDAPISRIDLLSCRNTLMYFTAESQAKILRRLHFATTEHGVLMLGKAESTLAEPGLFAPLDGHRRFFRKDGVPAGEEHRRLELPRDRHAGDLDGVLGEALRAGRRAMIVIDRAGRVSFVNRRAAALLPVSGQDLGRLIQDTDVSFRPSDLRPLLLRARSELHPVTAHGVSWRAPDGTDVTLDIEVVPLVDEQGALLGSTVSYLDVTAALQLREELELTRGRLQTAFEELQSTTEELETTNEELQSTVEELETTNEELQSTNEELETMNQELRSVNEELYARGAQEQARTARADHHAQVLDVVMESLQASVIVVDRDLRVQLWSQASTDLWGVRPEEVLGSRLSEVDMGLEPDRLLAHARAVLAGDEQPDGDAVAAVNRRGRPITVRITARPVMSGPDREGVILIVRTDPQGLAAAAGAMA